MSCKYAETTVKFLINARAFIRIIAILLLKKGITSDVIAVPVTHIVSSPGEPTIVVFIDLHDYLICMTFIIISQY